MTHPTDIYELQLIDNKIDRLNKQEKELPQKKDLGELEEKISKLNKMNEKQNLTLGDAERQQKRLENETDQLTEKINKEKDRLFGGSINNPKELRSIQEEVKVLEIKKDELETLLLEKIDEVENLKREVEVVRKAQINFVRTAQKLQEQIIEQTAAIKKDLAKEEQRRTAAVAKVPADLLDLYNTLRQEKNGVAVAKLEEITCLGCHLELPAQEMDKMINPSDIWRCPHCRRILVLVE